MNESTRPLLWYFADPMCSWCWGFAPVMAALRADCGARMEIALVLGGLRAGETAPLTPTARADILHHWQQVHERTGQPFRFENALPDGFVYDTEPACRAVVAVASLDATRTFTMFTAIQHAFYAEGRDVTRAAVLAACAAELGIDAAEFGAAFTSETMRERTHAHFRQARRAGVRGFPTLILQQDHNLTPIAAGWQALDTVREAIEQALGR
ncbi:MAG: protein-disulfide isomerase [Thiobacillus sp. 65-29]|nr:MAG: protein-disulfide isomerase [Thiobacillus sp. 65-29]